jgi:hypothetical protein
METDLATTLAVWAKSGMLELREENHLDDGTLELVYEVPNDVGGVSLLRAYKLPQLADGGDRTAAA